MGTQPEHPSQEMLVLLWCIRLSTCELKHSFSIVNSLFRLLATEDPTEPLLLQTGWQNSAFRAHLQLAGQPVGWEGGQDKGSCSTGT